MRHFRRLLHVGRPDLGGGQPVPARLRNHRPVVNGRPLASARLLPFRRLLAIPILALACAVVAPSAIGQASAATRGAVGVASASYQTGLGDESDEMFNDPLWRQLHIRYV